MLRRLFLTSPLALLGLGCKASPPKIPLIKDEPKVHSEFGLGAYKSHFVRFHGACDVMPMDDENLNRNLLRYISFPIEDSMVIEYENGCENYTGFNLKKGTIHMINTCSIQHLLTFRVRDKFSDEFSQLFEFPETIESTGKEYKSRLKLSSISMYEKVQSDYVPAMILPGEFIISREQRYKEFSREGTPLLKKLNSGS